MVARLVGDKTASDNFGFTLDHATAASNRARVASESAACLASQPEIFEHAHQLISTARGARDI